MKKSAPDSPVVEFVAIAWQNAGGKPHSWDKYNHQVRDAVRIATQGFEWEPGDAAAVLAFENRRYSIHRCLGEGGVEWLYTVAIRAANRSAVVEIETYMNRTAIIADEVEHGTVHGSPARRQRDRLCCGATFLYGDRRLKVNSFRDDGRANCTEVLSLSKKTTAKRFQIGPDEIKADRKARKDAAKK